ncbi:MAG TPA: STAS domain-containing protein [Streptosporangiaceae bacterium]|nr:STAS domain-containing protein [Streptosporangiaceae bacterium]
MACADAALVVTAERGEKHVVVRLTGDLDVSNRDQLREVLDAMLESKPRHVIVDLSELTFADCAGLSVLIAVRGWLAERGHVLTVTAPQPIVRRLLMITGMDALFRLGEDEHHACRSSADRDR